MRKHPDERWLEDNQRYLTAALDEVREILRSAGEGPRSAPSTDHDRSRRPSCDEIAAGMAFPPALETLCRVFGLSAFERRVLLLCAGMELDGAFAALCASSQGDSRRSFATFGLALGTFPEAHWSALNPGSPLRFWRLVEIDRGESVTSSPLRIDERILHYLTGVFQLDERLWGLVRSWTPNLPLTPSHRGIADLMVKAWSRPGGWREGGGLPIIQLYGSERESKRDIAAAACRDLGLDLYLSSSQSLPANPSELEALLRLWGREAALSSSALLLEVEESDFADQARSTFLDRVLDGATGALVVSGSDRRRTGTGRVLDFEVVKPKLAEQHEVWRTLLAERGHELDGWLDSIVAQFDFDPRTILAAGREALENADGAKPCGPGASPIADAIWEACRKRSRPKLNDLALRIDPAAGWDDLVLPAPQVETLKSIAAHLRQRVRVYEQWGFAAKCNRGLGISALFVGESGTGKTLAAEVLANELHLDLYRIDLSQVVSKYIGETEKNLRRVFDAAEEGGAILLFDEADALFGKRSEVKDSHDRYANIEVSYLLQRMEAYRGLAILTTNMKSALDTAFLRRLRFIVQFPFPDLAQRMDIWRRIFPRSTPLEGVDFAKLARLNVAGGNIRNIALNAAFLAADKAQPVRMGHLLSAAQTEYRKLERPLTEAEIGGWV